jgi:hypothetical protein
MRAARIAGKKLLLELRVGARSEYSTYARRKQTQAPHLPALRFKRRKPASEFAFFLCSYQRSVLYSRSGVQHHVARAWTEAAIADHGWNIAELLAYPSPLTPLSIAPVTAEASVRFAKAGLVLVLYPY